jgi:hypothetical protein
MTDLRDDLRAAFESTGHDVVEVSENRGQMRVVLRETGLDADRLRELATEAAGSVRVLGLNVTTEAVGGRDDVGTVVSVRYRD